MSGTIPVNMKSSLRRELCLAPDTIMCHQSCNQPELIYNIEPPVTSNDHLGKCVLDIVGKYNLGPTERGLVFVMTVGDGIQLASYLRCEFYWSMKTKVSGADSTDTCKGDQSRTLQEIPQLIIVYEICYNLPPGDSSEN